MAPNRRDSARVWLGGVVAMSANDRRFGSGSMFSDTTGRSIRSASFAATTSGVDGSRVKSADATTKWTGWSANGARRGWSGAASRSTALGVSRSLDFRFTCELVSWTARVSTPATTERSSGSSSKTGMSVGRRLWSSSGKIRR